MKKYFFILLLLLCSSVLNAQNLKLIPYPSNVKMAGSRLAMARGSGFYTDNPRFKYAVNYLNEEIGSPHKTAARKQKITIAITPGLSKPGAYRLSTVGKVISIKSSDSAGVFNGVITLLQLYQSAKKEGANTMLPGLIINDEPRYQWRGFMLDESRHFFGKEVVKQLLNWMAFYKLNRFHWHLTDAQGWRLAIEKYPLLATVGGIGNFTDSTAQARYYTQNDIREIVKYAKRRNIEIVPEIDMPGHATGATHAYPELSGGTTPRYENFTFNPAKEGTYQFMGNVLKEVKALFPDGRIHIGGDEVALGIKAWESNPDVQKLMTDKGFTDYQQAEFYFLKRIADTVQKLNYKVMCWDETVAAGLPTSNVIIDWWRQNKPEVLTEAINKGYNIILCPRLPLYLDFVQDSTHRSGRKWGGLFNTYLDIYHFPENSLADSICKKTNIIGIQANLWTETVSSKKRLDYLLFPRLAAAAEAGWCASSAKNDDMFNQRLKAHLLYYKKAGIYYYDPFNPKEHEEAIDQQPKQEVKD
ncbi:beta-N-acetylhexosaminidase [Mucilaginibacter sabulilitoris]|uniref:beta-N-acetylhexosaminidase n=1 Tax=Mucilaginibacter sabulilitoris TaxID=1173583 RepID=A0ABZ0TTX3_9SPHI|nr:beta-N-acetylhexosaminidase [Mucilaginibacter sabulilitoris]WPU96369.1 beta-N-acetylhexosaminidase [Mucilaginibacter sabulilitoris]